MRVFYLAAFLLALVVAPASSDEPVVDYFDGLRAWSQGERELAVSIWSEAADAGDLRSMKALGEQYRTGSFLLADLGLAFFWYDLAAKRGDEEASAAVRDLRSKVPAAVAEAAAKAADDWKPNIGFSDAAKHGAVQSSAIAAVEAGDLKKLQTAFADGFEADALADGTPIFFLCLAKGEVTLVQAFLAADKKRALLGLSVNGVPALHIAAIKGDAALVRALLDHGFNPAIEDAAGMSAHQVARVKNFSAAADLLEQAYKLRRLDIVRQLVAWGYVANEDASEEAFRAGVKLVKHSRLKADNTRIDQALLTLLSDVQNPISYHVLVERAEGSRRFVNYDRLTALSQEKAKSQAIQSCAQRNPSASCRAAYVAPEGLCIAYAWGASKAAYISSAFSSPTEAANDAMAKCSRASEADCQMGKAQPCSG